MTESQLISLKHAIAIINSVIAEKRPADNSWDCPVISFARRYLTNTGMGADTAAGTTEFTAVTSKLRIRPTASPT